MKVEEILQRVKSLYSKGVQSHDSRLKSRHIYSALLTSRNDILTKIKRISLSNYQELPCVELEEVSPSLCDCIPFNCSVKRTKYPLPTLLYIDNNLAIKNVSSIDGVITKFSETTLENLSNFKGRRFTAKDPFFYIRDNYLYIENKKGIDLISIIGLFTDPIEAFYYPSYCDNEISCLSALEQDFPIDESLIKRILQGAFYELVGLFNRTKEDKSNDTIDDSQQEQLEENEKL